MTRLTATVLLACSFGTVNAGPVAEEFAKGMFGIPWDASRRNIENALPGGTWKTSANVECYSLADARTVFTVARPKGERIIVCLDAAGKITAFGVDFPATTDGHANLMSAMVQKFGAPDPARSWNRTSSSGMVSQHSLWPTDDFITVEVGRTTTDASDELTLAVMKSSASPANQKVPGVR